MYLSLTTDNTNLWWLIALTFVVALGYFLLTSISFRVYKKVKRHFSIQYAITKNKNSRKEIEEERILVEKGFKTRLYLQIILGFVLHINLAFIVSLIFDIFEWGYLYICLALCVLTVFLTRRAMNYIDKRKARKEDHELQVLE